MATAVEYPTIINAIEPIEEWNADRREHEVIATLFYDKLVEPYITWAGDLSWRVTAEGKKAGLK